MIKTAILSTLLLLNTEIAFATSRMGDAEVRDDNGIPCFTITKDEENRSGVPALGAITVDDATIKPSNHVWSFSFKPIGKSQPIASSGCIRYGEAPDGTETSKAAEHLQVGKIYEVFLNASSPDSHDPTFGYDAKFCLVPQQNSIAKVHQIRYSNGWHYELCTP